jgi:hypothetical protein
MLSMMLDKRWVKRDRHSRALDITAVGKRELATRLGVRVAE